MTEVTADLAGKTDQTTENAVGAEGENTALARCYGRIGISAVVAAVRYQGSAKNPAYAPVSTAWRDRIAEAAA